MSGFPAGIAGQVEGAGPGTPLLWGHGLASNREDEDRAGIFRWPTTRRVLRWDAPGHGRSRPVGDPDELLWSGLGELMLSVADGHGIERFVAGGASMGAATSLWAAVIAPERVAALLLVVPPTAWETRAAQTALYRRHVELLGQGGVQALADEVASEPLPPVFEAFGEQVRAARRAGYLAADPENLANVLRGAAASDLPAPERLSAIGVPALVLAWPGDPGHPVSTAEILAAALPGARLEVAADARAVLGWSGTVTAWLEDLAD